MMLISTVYLHQQLKVNPSGSLLFGFDIGWVRMSERDISTVLFKPLISEKLDDVE